MAKEYNGWIIFRERGILPGIGGEQPLFYSALRKSDYEAAQRGEMQWPIREMSMKAIKAAIDRINQKETTDGVTKI